jgi:hypothetical protein
MHWGKGTAEYLSPEYGTILVHTTDADHTRDIRDRRSVTPVYIAEWCCCSMEMQEASNNDTVESTIKMLSVVLLKQLLW